MAIIKAYGKNCAVVSMDQPDTHYGPVIEYSYGSYSYVLLQSFEFPSELNYREIQHVRPTFFCFPLYTDPADVNIRPLVYSFDPNSVSYNTVPPLSVEFDSSVDSISSAQYVYLNTITAEKDTIRLMLENGIRLVLYPWSAATSSDSINPPYLEFTCSEALRGYNVEQTYPIGGATISKSIPTTFSWANTRQDMDTFVAPYITSGYFRWRVAGSTSYTSISVGKQTSITIPANTFTDGKIEWSVEVTASSGAVTTTPWVTVSVVEPTSTATINSPKNAVVDGTADITFSWNHVIANGTKQTAFDLQTSSDGSAWTTLRSVSTSDTFVTIPAGTFTAGDLYWRVRTYNLDSVAGEWSETAHVIVFAAPEAPGVTVDVAEPQFQIRWQQSGQQAYEIMLDGVVIKKAYGTAGTYQYDGYLEPGTYTIQVRIQNQYALWSEWSTLILTIENTEGSAITLSAEGDNDVTVRWNLSGEYSKYILYRDGVKLAETTDVSYVDHFALGDVTYQVRGVYADSGYYTLSNEATVHVTVDTILVAAVDDPVWLRLDKSKTSLRATAIGDYRSVTYLHYVGAQLPSAEIGEAVSKTYRLDCAWSIGETESIRAFERLIGRTVCVKTHTGRRIIGILGEVSCTEDCMIVSYQATVTMIDWEG